MGTSLRACAAALGVAVLLIADGATATAGRPAAPTPARVCTSGVPGDVNGDGHAEVAVSEVNGGARRSGGVHIFYGHRSGLVTKATGTARDDQYLDQRTRGVPGLAERNDAFGAATAFGDFNADGCDDLAMGAPRENRLRGAVTILYGSPSGIRTAGAQFFRYADIFTADSSFAQFGSSLVVGDLNNDGTDDLAVGAPGRWLTDGGGRGAVAVLFGSSHGLGGGRSPFLIDPRSPGLPPLAGTDSRHIDFGAALAVGDFNGNGGHELAIGSPVAGNPGEGRGAVQAVEIDEDRLTAGLLTTPDLLGLRPAQPYADYFGRALVAGDVNDDGFDDLAIGVPGYEPGVDIGAGAVVLLHGTAAGLSEHGRELWWQGSPGLENEAKESNGGLGAALAVGRLDGDAYPDLAIGTPGYGAFGNSGGSVTVLRGGANGLTTAGFGGERYSQATPGIVGVPETDDHFGATVVIALVQSRRQGSLIIGAPGESIHGVPRVGLVHQLGIGSAGPTPRMSRTLHLNSRGVKGKPSRNAFFGGALN